MSSSGFGGENCSMTSSPFLHFGRKPGRSFGQFLILFTQGFVPSLFKLTTGSGDDYFQHKSGFPYCGPSRSPVTMILRNVNLHYIRKLSCKHQLFWLSGSCEEAFLNYYTQFLHFCDYPPSEENLSLNMYNFDIPLPKDDLYQV
jgi:hypothetical protein